MSFNIWTDCPRVPITQLLEFIVDNRGKTVPTAPSGHKLIATNCVTNNTLFPVYEKVRYLSDETYRTWFRAHPIPGDILFVNKGTPGRVCMVPNPVDFCIAQDMIALRADDSKIYNKYLFAVLRSSEIQTQIYNTNVGDVIPHFKKQFMDQLLIPIPERKIQEAIGDLYYTLSYKIEHNKKINDNLQQQAATIYKSWFVDFSSAVEREMVDSEIGKIPRGWRVYRLSEFLPVITGKKNANVSSNKGEYPFFSCSQDFSWTDDYSFEGHAILVAGNGDFNVKWYKGKFEAYQRTYVLIPYEERYTSWLYYAVKYNLARITSAARGSVIKFITKGNLENFAFAAPSNLAACEVIDTFFAINQTIDCLTQENYRLAALRDTLLPKLMRGEIDVSDIDI